ncbi:hypothetical protein BCR39DRAFT_562620 [Naematelia encephala]|uniref:Zn(2)-C6 fungal-type domain-containing protein n=1 Tax=Naematelia encephala TaxID=71784 RepID=A0A1Y2AGV3_9TREE|nr:hypothetical protein BCR39DRAFT_562620 [Naematelia encephala]
MVTGGPSPTPPRSKSGPLAKGAACAACKVRKIRCPAQKPACTNCIKRGRDCSYPGEESSRTASRSMGRIGSAINDAAGTSTLSDENPYGSDVDPTFPPILSVVGDGEFEEPPMPLPSFLPVVGGGGADDQPIPLEWDNLDFSWLTQIIEPVTAEEGIEVDGATQEHLLWLYFSRSRSFAVEMHIARFYERLGSGDPVFQPHSSLLNALYLIACSSSPILSVRLMEEKFANRAKQGIEDGLSSDEGVGLVLLDLTRAATLVAGWLWSKGRGALAVVMTSTAARFAIAARLDQIPSAVFTAPKPEPQLRRRRAMHCTPVRDQIDLADRIYAFWAVFFVDICGAVAICMPSCLHTGSITTPLPWTWSTYENAALDLTVREERLLDILDTGYVATDLVHAAEFSHGIKAIFLLYCASSLSPAPSSPTPFDGSESSISSLSTPAAFPQSQATEARTGMSSLETDKKRSIGEAIRRFVEGLPVYLKTIGAIVEGSELLTAGAASIHSIICCAEMFLRDNNTYRGTNDEALYHAGRLVGLIRMLGEGDVGDLGLFIHELWGFAMRVLIREVKRLTRVGDAIGAAVIDEQVDVIITALRRGVGRESQADYVDDWRHGPPSDVDPEERPVTPL